MMELHQQSFTLNAILRSSWTVMFFCIWLLSQSHFSIFTLCCLCVSGHQSGFCMICIMQNHIIQAFANTGNAIKPVSFIRDLKSKTHQLPSTLWLCPSSFCLLVFSVGCVRSQTPDFVFFFFFWLNTARGTVTQHWPQCPMWQQPVTAVQKWSGEAAGCEWTPCREQRWGVSRTLTWWGTVL